MFAVRIADELFHELRFGQLQALDGVGGEKTVLDVEKWRLGLFGDAPSDQRQIGGLLDIAREQHAPATVRHTHDIVVAGVDVQTLRSQRAGADVKHHRQTLAGDDVEHFFHQNEPLPGSEVGHPTTGESETFAGARRTMLGLQLEEG